MYIFNYINNIFKARATKVGHVGPQFACSTGAHLLSHDDSANRPLSKPDDKANTIVFTFLWLMGYYIVMSQRQSLHVSSFVSAYRFMSFQFIVSACCSASRYSSSRSIHMHHVIMHHFSASRYMALHSANRFMSIQFIVSACRSCSTSLAVAPVASRTWSPYSSSRSIHMHHVIMHQRCRYMSVVST